MVVWEDIRLILDPLLEQTSHIGTYIIIGSRDARHDIDTIITKKPISQSKDFFKEIHKLFDRVDEQLQKKHSGRLIRTARFSDEEEILYIAQKKPEDIVFQVLTYVSLRQIQMHWHADLAPEDDVMNTLKEGLFLKGTYDDLCSQDFAFWKNEHLFIRLNDSDRINSHFPQELLLRRMNVLYDFIMRKQLGKKPSLAKTHEEIRSCFYEVTEQLDK